MKEKILFVNSCVRGENESRTLALAKTALSRLDGDIEEIRLADANLKPLDAAGLAKRAESAEKTTFPTRSMTARSSSPPAIPSLSPRRSGTTASRRFSKSISKPCASAG